MVAGSIGAAAPALAINRALLSRAVPLIWADCPRYLAGSTQWDALDRCPSILQHDRRCAYSTVTSPARWTEGHAPARALLHSSASALQLPATASSPAPAASASGAQLMSQPAPRFSGGGRGPLAIYTAGVSEGRYRQDPRQEAALRLLQDLYVQLEAKYPRKTRPSNLTLVDNVSTSRSRKSWCDSRPLISACSAMSSCTRDAIVKCRKERLPTFLQVVGSHFCHRPALRAAKGSKQ
jgi:hypothetical protein